MLDNIEETAQRIGAMLELAGVLGVDVKKIKRKIIRCGVDEVIDDLNFEYDLSLQIGDYVVASVAEKGFWSNDFGWCSHKRGATGYSQPSSVDIFLSGFSPSCAKLLSYVDAVDFED